MLGPGSGEGSVVVVEYDGTSPGVGALAQAIIAKTDAMRPMRGTRLLSCCPAISLYLCREMANIKPPLPPSERRESPKPQQGKVRQRFPDVGLGPMPGKIANVPHVRPQFGHGRLRQYFPTSSI